MREVTLTDMLEAREDRVRRQNAFRTRYHGPVVSFSLNIPGPVKDSPLIRRAFRAGQEQLEAGLCAAKLPVLGREEHLSFTGCEALYAAGGTAREIKKICVSIEDCPPLGRLLDLDVLDGGGRKLDRDEVGGGSRDCIVCGASGRGCASRRVHSAEELQRAARRIIEDHFTAADREKVSALASKALLDEVCVTPKPGLVDRANSGSHRDMDIFTFTASIAALAPYWGTCFQIGMETAALAPEDTFSALRQAGRQAERTMFAAAGGVNTHKGAVFTLGTICGAAGRLWNAQSPCRTPETILSECGRMTEAAVRADFAALEHREARTAGERLYLETGMAGIRGEAARGFPSIAETALPALREARAAHIGRNGAGAAALLRLIARGEDTNMISRGGRGGAAEAAEECRRLVESARFPPLEDIDALNRRFVENELSPGGCADLLAAAFFLLDWEEQF